MTKFKLWIVGLLIVSQTGTCKKETLKDVPSCMLKKIEALQNEKVANPPASVWQYEYNGKTVYYIPAKCCDIPSVLYDADCNVICAPDGGLTGRGDGKCKDFFDKRSNGKLLWQDGRK